MPRRTLYRRCRLRVATFGEAVRMRQTGRPADRALGGGDARPAATGAAADGRPVISVLTSPHALRSAETLSKLAVSPETGLDSDEVRARQATYGRNALELQPPKSAAAI